MCFRVFCVLLFVERGKVFITNRVIFASLCLLIIAKLFHSNERLACEMLMALLLCRCDLLDVERVLALCSSLTDDAVSSSSSSPWAI
jgi:hypothetical protein